MQKAATHGQHSSLNKSDGFTQPGVERINDSIWTYVWAILGAQAQIRTSILGTGTAFDAQKQFLANVEDTISSPVDLPSAIARYQDVLRYARSKVDFAFGIGLYMAQSDMELLAGGTTIQNYNEIAGPGQKLGVNGGINVTTLPADSCWQYDTYGAGGTARKGCTANWNGTFDKGSVGCSDVSRPVYWRGTGRGTSTLWRANSTGCWCSSVCVVCAEVSITSMRELMCLSRSAVLAMATASASPSTFSATRRACWVTAGSFRRADQFTNPNHLRERYAHHAYQLLLLAQGVYRESLR